MSQQSTHSSLTDPLSAPQRPSAGHSPAPTPASFDYSALPSEKADLARDAAEAIRTSHKRIGGYILAIGEQLSAVKDALDHGQFGAWLIAEFSWDERTARRYMVAWQTFGDKTDIVSELPVTVIHSLAAPSTPPAVREQVIEGIKAGERFKPAAIKDMIFEAKVQAKMAATEAKLTAEDRKRQKQAEARRKRREEQRIIQLEQKAEEQRALLENLRREATEAAKIIASGLGHRPFNDAMSILGRYQTGHRFAHELGSALHRAFWEESRNPERDAYRIQEELRKQQKQAAD